METQIFPEIIANISFQWPTHPNVTVIIIKLKMPNDLMARRNPEWKEGKADWRFKFISTVCELGKTQHKDFLFLFFPPQQTKGGFLRRRIDTIIRFMFGVLFYIFSVNTFSDGIYSNPITKMSRKIKEITLLKVLLALSAACLIWQWFGKSHSMTWHYVFIRSNKSIFMRSCLSKIILCK